MVSGQTLNLDYSTYLGGSGDDYGKGISGGTDWAVPGIYSGDGTDDIATFRSSSGLWAVQGVPRVYFGGTSDLPITR